MLVHPEIYAWLNSQNRTEPKREKSRPLVTRGEKINRGGPEKTREAQQYEPDQDEQLNEVEYLNERKSNYNFYA